MTASRLLFSNTLARVLPCRHRKWDLFFSSQYQTNETSSTPWRHNLFYEIHRRTFSLKPTLSETSADSRKEKQRQEIEQALSRVDLDLKMYGRLNREDLESILKEIKNHNIAITSTQGLYLLRCCGNFLSAELPQNRTLLVQAIWELLLSTKVQLDISHFNALLRVYLENEHVFNPIRFLAFVIESDIQPNRVTYHRLVAAYCQKGDLNGATKILDIMKHKEIPIDALVFNAIIMGHSTIGDWESANGIIRTMIKNGIEPDAETYRELLCSYAKHGVSESISSVIDTCKKKGIEFTDEHLFAALYIAAIHGHSELVDIWLNQMKKTLGYNRACVNIILRLVTQRKEDEAFKVLLSMKPRIIDGRTTPSGRFFIRQVVKTDCSSEKIILYCQQLVQTGKNVRAFFTAVEAASSLGKSELMERLFKEMKGDKNSLRPHFLGPLLASESRIGGEKKVLEMLRKMATIRVFPNVATVKQHVLPHMTGDSQTLFQKLYSSRISFFVISVSLLQKSLDSLDFEDATRVTSTFYIEMDPKLRSAAVSAYLKTRNATGFAKLIRSLLPESREDFECDLKDFSSEVIGPIFEDICSQTSKSEQLDVVIPLLEALKKQGLSISLSVAQFLREKLDGKIASAAVDLLAELSSGELIPVELDPRPTRLHWTNKAQVVKRRNEFCTLARERKLEEALASKKEMEALNISFTDGMNLLLIDLYSHHGLLDEAFAVFSEFFDQQSDLIVLPSKLMNFATQLVKGDRIEDAIRVLQQLKSDPRALETTEMTNAVNASAMRLMNAVAEKGDVKVTKRIYQTLENSKALKMKNSLLGPLVKVHVVREDLESALQEFDRCSKERRATPLNTELAARLIEKDDTGRLERLMRMNSKVHGEMNSLYDLSLAFLRCQRVSQAKKVLETPGLRALNRRLNDVCSYYVRQKRIDELENFVKITRDLFNVDRNMLYDHLLSACIQADKPLRAVGVWTLMQEEVHIASHWQIFWNKLKQPSVTSWAVRALDKTPVVETPTPRVAAAAIETLTCV